MLKELKFNKWIDILLFINSERACYSQNISNKLQINYAHISKIIDLMVVKGFVNKEKDNHNERRKIISLTKKGQKLQEVLKEAVKIIEEKNDK